MNDENKHQVTIKIKLIEKQYLKSDQSSSKAYQLLYEYCDETPCCRNYSKAAMSIVIRHNQLKEDWYAGILETSQRRTEARTIGSAFEELLEQIKQDFQPDFHSSAYEQHAMQLKVQKSILKEMRVEIEQQRQLCGLNDKKKRDLLFDSWVRLGKVIIYFAGLLNNFELLKNHE
ncbi:MAG: hypothetical protein GY862_22495 [Gammaproteobacteria bacterium]|nr:hypothetical protein [Gammaproteobacteria bacterium]